jgi:RNA polymerase sigma-70 factor (ECF subfamily)
MCREERYIDDIVQDVMVAALERSPGEDVPLEKWLQRLTVAAIQKYFPRNVRRTLTRDRACEAVVNDTPGQKRWIEEEEFLSHLEHALLDLGEPYRSAIQLRFYESLPFEFAAERLGVPAERVQAHVSRGLELLRERLNSVTG